MSRLLQRRPPLIPFLEDQEQFDHLVKHKPVAHRTWSRLRKAFATIFSMLDLRAQIRDEVRDSLYKRSRVIGLYPARNRYRVRWTNLPPRADTFEPAAQIPRHLVDTFRIEFHLPAWPAEVWNGHSPFSWGEYGEYMY